MTAAGEGSPSLRRSDSACARNGSEIHIQTGHWPVRLGGMHGFARNEGFAL
jgi:hypothetical protein